ncbi:uncharacterized protein [Dysidea avara]|uniref:uncharacterized protein n=1 Tax=Dysidea avara TaxID=196820 RepID=UPI00331D4E49
MTSNAADSTTLQLLQSDNGDDHDAQDGICTCICRQEVQRLEKEAIETSEEIRKLKQQLKEAHDDIARLTQQVKDISTESSRYQKLAEERKFCFSNIEGSDKDVQFYTGLPSASIFYEVLDYVSPGRKRSNIVYHATAQQWANDQERGSEPCQATWRNYEVNAGHPANLSQIDELFLTLVRLRLNLKEQDLANRFEISLSSVSRIFTTWINFCYLRLGSLPCWPDRSTIRNTMPASFKELYPNTTVILDATEIRVNIPSSLLLQSQTYSNYKSANTLKALVAISPAGHVIFVSSLYTGCISDTQLVERSGFLSQLQRGDEVMADRGFTIEDLLVPLGVKLNIPPFLGNRDQMEGSEVVETQQIASLRIHIERAIRRVKEFDILSGVMSASVAPSANQIWTVCCLLTNFQNPLISC